MSREYRPEPFQLFPILDVATESALRDSIRSHGVLVPVFVSAGPWAQGATIDGHHRQRLAGEEGVKFRTIELAVQDADEFVELTRTLNVDRRQLSRKQRHELVADLRAKGHSLRAIAGAVGVDPMTVRKDLSTVDPSTVPDRIVGLDGKARPSTRPRPGDLVYDDSGESHVVAEIDEQDDGTLLIVTEDDPDDPQCVVLAPEDAAKRTVAKPDLGNGVSHPARFGDDLLPVLAGFLEPGWRVLDPFAGTGKIHALRELVDVDTVGVEIEPEWASLHPATLTGDALDLPFEDAVFDAVVTSPTYGNRLADSHDAYDPETRRSYTHDLGRPLHPANSGGLQWGEDYREFHRRAWAEVIRVLRPGGLFVLNIKDHIRGGIRQPVSAWHVRHLLEAGLRFVDCVPVVTTAMRAGDNRESRVGAELVWALEVAE